MKQKLFWDKKYEIGNTEIDFEHQIFLSLIQKIDNAFSDNYDNEFILLLIKELYKYADFHFISEENRMIFSEYPDYKSHKEEHSELLSELNQKISYFDLKFINQDKLITFLFSWFINHTTTSDLKFGNHLKDIKA